MKRLLPSLGWILLGLLVVAGMLLSAGRNQSDADPVADSFSPSGTSALVALLRSRGYAVTVDRSPRPKLDFGDVAIAFDVSGESTFTSKSGDSDLGAVQASLIDSVRHGAILFALPVEQDFQGSSLQARQPVRYERPDSAPRSISDGGRNQDSDYSDQTTEPSSALGDQQSDFVWARRVGAGYVVTYSDAIGLTNRFIDQADNAQVFLETLRAFAQPGARVVFTEATAGHEERPGLLATIGTWAEAGWYQVLFLFAVIVYSLNRRFGLPEVYRPKQKGARELLDAVTDTYIRAQASGAALHAAGVDADSRLRSVLKLPRDAGSGELYRLLPESLVDALTKVKAAGDMERVRPADAFGLIQKLDRDLDAFLQARRPQAARRRKPSRAMTLR